MGKARHRFDRVLSRGKRIYAPKFQGSHDFPGPGKCRFCGCTDKKRCRGGCAWVSNDRDCCTMCVDKI